jgi:T5orf172 domain
VSVKINEDPPFARQLAEELAADKPELKLPCMSCAKEFPLVGPSGVPSITCPFCGYRSGEKHCEDILNTWAERRKREAEITRLGELLSKGPPAGKPPWFNCPFCRELLPASLAERNFAEVECPRCHHVDVYVYNGEAFRSFRDCLKALKLRLEETKKAKEKARERELAEAANEITTGAQPDPGQASGGYVYALLNSTMAGLVKIGKTEREPDERAKELSCGTGIPTPFVVAYAEWFQDCSAAEDYVHSLMEKKGFRVSQNREFFCAPLKAAIQAIMKAKEWEDQPKGTLA